jgi:hypothetical protein
MSNDDSVMPTGVYEVEPDPLGEAQGSGTEGARRGESPAVGVVARSSMAGLADRCPLASKAARSSASEVFPEGLNE